MHKICEIVTYIYVAEFEQMDEPECDLCLHFVVAKKRSFVENALVRSTSSAA